MKHFLSDYLVHIEDALSLLSIRHNPSEKSFCQKALLLRMRWIEGKIGFVKRILGEAK